MDHGYCVIRGMMRNIINNELRKLIIDYFKKYKKDFVKCPGSIGHHHKQTGGLLDHTIEVCDLAIAIGNNECIEYQDEKEAVQDDTIMDNPNYICWNDRLLISALLHDVGKINQYAVRDYPVREENGIDTVYKWTYKMSKEDSKNYDHAVWVVNDFRTVTKKNLPDDIRNAILAHHGGWTTNGAKCDTLLDAILHAADLISSRAGK